MYFKISSKELGKAFIDPYEIQEKLYASYYELCKNITCEYELDKGSIFLEGLKNAISSLPETQRKVIELRYGLLDGNIKSSYEISKKLNISLYTSRALEAKALRILRIPKNYNQITSCGKISLLEEEIKNLKKIITQKNKMLKRFTKHIRLYSLGLSTRAYNCLINAGYVSVDQITHFTSVEQLMSIKNMGRTSATEIWNKLNENDKEITYEMSLLDINLSTRAINCLTKAGYFMVSEVKDLSDHDLLKISGLGEGTLKEIREKL